MNVLLEINANFVVVWSLVIRIFSFNRHFSIPFQSAPSTYLSVRNLGKFGSFTSLICTCSPSINILVPPEDTRRGYQIIQTWNYERLSVIRGQELNLGSLGKQHILLNVASSLQLLALVYRLRFCSVVGLFLVSLVFLDMMFMHAYYFLFVSAECIISLTVPSIHGVLSASWSSLL